MSAREIQRLNETYSDKSVKKAIFNYLLFVIAFKDNFLKFYYVSGDVVVQEYVLWYEDLGMNDVDRVGGKNASLGEMISNLSNVGVQVPGGFATTSFAFNEFLEQSGLNDKIYQLLDDLDVGDVNALAEVWQKIRQWVIDTPFLPDMQKDIEQAYAKLAGGFADDASFAVRSSATAEDMPDASFAGQQETFLNVRGLDAVMIAIKHVFASFLMTVLFLTVFIKAMTIVVLRFLLVFSVWCAVIFSSSGVMFSIDTESGFEDVVFITSSLWFR